MINNHLFAQIAFEHVRDSLILTDANGLTLWVNQAFIDMTGFQLADIQGRQPSELLQGPASSQESKNALAKAIKDKVACTVDIVNYTKSGEEYVTEVIMLPIVNKQADAEYFIGMQRDVTVERTHFQESIDFRAYQRALDEQAIVSVADAKGDITYVNQKFIDISGYSSSELIGKNHRIINSNTHKRDFFKHMWRDIKRGKTWNGVVCNRNKFGELYWVDTTIVPVKGPDGKILRYVSIRYDITERTKINNELKLAAITDKLTGLLNREGLYSKLSEMVNKRAYESVTSQGLLVKLGLDHFKELNDTFGHHYGDTILQEIAKRLSEVCLEIGQVARIGGDEFAAIVFTEDMTEMQVDAFLKDLHSCICDTLVLRKTDYTPSCSIGVVRYPDDAETVKELLINVDIALYEAKHSARNQFLFFDASIKEKLDHKKYIKDLLIAAIEKDHFSIVMQPICDLESSEHVGFEILLRLSDNGTPISPDVFIPIAEDLGLIAKIGDIVLNKAMSAFRTILDSGLSPGKIAINFAPPQFLESNVVERIQEVMAQYKLPPKLLVIELTETAFIGSTAKRVAHVLARLQALDIEVALDDFGTGFSSLSHLRDFKVNKIKIDKSFISDIEIDSTDLALVEGLVGFAQKMGLDVVAEGVETETQLQLLRNCKCQYMQGYYHSRPLTLENAITFLQASS